MIMRIYTVKDIKADEFGPLFLVKKDELAKRSFRKMMENQELILDYELYCVGSFDTETGKFKVPEAPVLLITGDQIFQEIMEKAGDNAVTLRLKELGDKINNLSSEELEALKNKIKEEGYRSEKAL